MRDFELIYEEFHIPIYKYLVRLTGDQELSCELAQETFVQAYSGILRYNGKCSLFTWLCAIAKNCYLKYLRKNKKIILNAEPLENIADSISCDPQELLLQRETIKELIDALVTMKKIYRDVIIMRVYFDRSYKEIAKMMGITEPAAKVRFHRGIEILKDDRAATKK